MLALVEDCRVACAYKQKCISQQTSQASDLCTLVSYRSDNVLAVSPRDCLRVLSSQHLSRLRSTHALAEALQWPVVAPLQLRE